MKRISKLFILFIISTCIILILPFVTAGETWAWYNETNVSYPAYGVECGTGGLAPGIDVWFCWLNYTNKVMDHSFMNFTQMDNYYNPGDGLIIEPGDTYTLSAYAVTDSVIASEPSMLSGLFAYIRALFV